MYERNAIVLERYFNQMFGYNMKNNIKTNFKDYCELVEYFEKYRDITDEEDNIMQEYDLTANKIREVQKRQEILSKKIVKYQADRENLFQNIDENSETIQKKFEAINNNIEVTNEQIKENANNFIDVIAEFSEKSLVRTNCGRTRRNIESEYNKKLTKALNDYKEIDVDIEKVAKQFIDTPTDDIEEELKEKIKKNGEKEKIPFNMEVITKAITLCVDIQKRETEILANIYDKTNKLFSEIKSNATKGDKHKKIIKDSKSKLEFVGALKEYLVQFLDNERLTAVNGADEHNKLMKEACENLDEDIVQINNLYTLLLKEISKKITKKSYAELYNIDYLKDLEKKSEEFEKQIKKLNLPVTIINPNYWRIEGMKKIYDVFYKNVTEEYGRDLSEYMPKEEIIPEDEADDDWDFDDEKELKEERKNNKTRKIIKRKIKGISQEEEKSNSEIDDEIDMILGFNDEDNSHEDFEDEEEIAPEDDFSEDEDDDVYYDIWGNDIKDEEDDDFDDDEDEDDFEDEDYTDEELEEDNDDEEDESSDWDDDQDDDDSDWDDDEDDLDDEDTDDEDWDDEDESDDDDWDDDIEEDNDEEELEEPKTKNKKNDDWGNEFIKIKEKDKSKKKKGFFDKFKK